MSSQEERRTASDRRKYALHRRNGTDRRGMISCNPEIATDEMSDSDSGMSEPYWKRFFNAQSGN